MGGLCVFLKVRNSTKGEQIVSLKDTFLQLRPTIFQVRIIFLGSVYVLLKREQHKSQTGNSDQFPYGHLSGIV